jgi:hypothetical protein
MGEGGGDRTPALRLVFRTSELSSSLETVFLEPTLLYTSHKLFLLLPPFMPNKNGSIIACEK